MINSLQKLLALLIACGTVNSQQEVPTTESALKSGSFGGILPVNYELDIRAPIWLSEHHFNQRDPIFQASVTVTFYTSSPIQRIHLHVKHLGINEQNVRLVNSNNQTIVVRNVFIDKNAQMLVVTLEEQLKEAKHYSLYINNYRGVVNDGYGSGLWRAFARQTSRAVHFAILTQLQMDHARSLLPCVDLPQFKANLQLSVSHPINTIAVSNTEQIVSVIGRDGWIRTKFAQTPRLPVYTFGFAILPSIYKKRSTTARNGIPIRLHYNPYSVNGTLARKLLKYAQNSFNYLHSILTSKIPLKKLDLIVVPELTVQGMENHGMITLRESYVSSQSDSFKLSVIAHETAHHWFGNVATVRSWSDLCIQEGLTDHLARIIVKRVMGEQSDEWRQYHLDKYLVSMEQEDNRHPPENLLLSNNPSIQKITDKCFGKAVFIFDSVHSLIGDKAFTKRLENFLTDFHLRSYQWTDLAERFNDITVDGYRISDAIHFWFTHGGYPTLIVHRDYTGKRQLKISQKHIYPIGNERRYGKSNTVWPIGLTLQMDGSEMRTRQLLQAREGRLKSSAKWPSVNSAYLMANADLAHFYRVNYDLHNWLLLAEALQSEPRRFSAVSRAQIVSDFCFYYYVRLIRGGRAIKRKLLNTVDANPRLFRKHFRYTANCRAIDK